jgi:hypothetical protein
VRAPSPTRRAHSSHLPSTPESRFLSSGTMPQDYTGSIGGLLFSSWTPASGADLPPPAPPGGERRSTPVRFLKGLSWRLGRETLSTERVCGREKAVEV